MPRVNLGKPEKDYIKGLFFERQYALNLSNPEMAQLLGYSESKYFRMIRKQSTKEWKLGDILRLAKALGISKDEIRSAI